MMIASNERISKEEMMKICANANFKHIEDININIDLHGLKFKLVFF